MLVIIFYDYEIKWENKKFYSYHQICQEQELVFSQYKQFISIDNNHSINYTFLTPIASRKQTNEHTHTHENWSLSMKNVIYNDDNDDEVKWVQKHSFIITFSCLFFFCFWIISDAISGVCVYMFGWWNKPICYKIKYTQNKTMFNHYDSHSVYLWIRSLEMFDNIDVFTFCCFFSLSNKHQIFINNR